MGPDSQMRHSSPTIHQQMRVDLRLRHRCPEAIQRDQTTEEGDKTGLAKEVRDPRRRDHLPRHNQQLPGD